MKYSPLTSPILWWSLILGTWAAAYFGDPMAPGSTLFASGVRLLCHAGLLP